MKRNKKAISFIASIMVIATLVVPLTLVLQTNSDNLGIDDTYETYSGFQVIYNEVPQSDPIVILNPKNYNIFYDSRYGSRHNNILLNYRTAPGVIAMEYILDGGIAQSIPPDNIIQKPNIGNHTLTLIGMNSTGDPCSSKTVNFYIGNTMGVCGGAPDCKDLTSNSTVHIVRSQNNNFMPPSECGLITDTIFKQELFLEGPERLINYAPYAKSVDLKYERIWVYVPFIVLRSGPWYDHEMWIISSRWNEFFNSWVTCGVMYSARYGDTAIIYFLTEILHVFGSVTYWNDETRHYDVFDIEVIHYDNTASRFYDAGELILEYPILGPVDFSQFPGVYYDKNVPKNGSWGWTVYEDWIQSYGFEANVFLGNYAGADSCPVQVRFNIPQFDTINDDLIPDEIEHTFIRTDQEPENYDPNYRGLENTFSMNIIPT